MAGPQISSVWMGALKKMTWEVTNDSTNRTRSKFDKRQDSLIIDKHLLIMDPICHGPVRLGRLGVLHRSDISASKAGCHASASRHRIGSHQQKSYHWSLLICIMPLCLFLRKVQCTMCSGKPVESCWIHIDVVLDVVLGCFGMFWGHVVGFALSNCPTVQLAAPGHGQKKIRAKLPSDVAQKNVGSKSAAGPSGDGSNGGQIMMNRDEIWWNAPKVADQIYPNMNLISTLLHYAHNASHCDMKRYEAFVDWIGIDPWRCSAQFH
jgi:hypothetical protein